MFRFLLKISFLTTVVFYTLNFPGCDGDFGASAAFAGALTSALISGASLATKGIVSISQSAPTARSCAIEIRNYHLDIELARPDVFVERGYAQMPPVPVIQPGYREACMFRKTQGPATGSYGVLTYRINRIKENANGRIEREYDGTTLVLMWGIPWAWEWNQNYQAVGIWNYSPTVNYDLFSKLYYKSGDFKRQAGGTTIVYEKVIYGDVKVKVTTTMNDESRATWIINIK